MNKLAQILPAEWGHDSLNLFNLVSRSRQLEKKADWSDTLQSVGGNLQDTAGSLIEQIPEHLRPAILGGALGAGVGGLGGYAASDKSHSGRNALLGALAGGGIGALGGHMGSGLDAGQNSASALRGLFGGTAGLAGGLGAGSLGRKWGGSLIAGIARDAARDPDTMEAFANAARGRKWGGGLGGVLAGAAGMGLGAYGGKELANVLMD